MTIDMRGHVFLPITVVTIFQLVSLAYTQVQSNDCSENCINRTCNNPSQNQLACTYGCYDGFWGLRCIEVCPPGCLTCDINYRMTQNCDSCKDGYYSNSATKNCTFDCPQGCETCSSASDCTSCTTGYFQTSSVCNLCPTSCTECSSATSCSHCKTGFTGNVCEKCSEGRYGDNCDLCRDNCKTCSSFNECQTCKSGFYNNGQVVKDCSLTSPPCPSTCSSCISSTECTTCKDGYYNTELSRTCTNECPNGCANCTSANTCTFCKANFYGNLCDTCVQGKYGINCDQICPGNCVTCSSAAMCDACRDGYYKGTPPNGGSTIHNDCRFNCPNSCESCIDYTRCNACRQHFKGNSCEDCVDGRYGTNCDALCSPNCLDKLCDRLSGTCKACNQNFIGDICDKCKIGTHGSNCDEQCSLGCNDNKCYQYTGHCTDGCINSNVRGDKCDSCADGYYGDDCSKTCNTNCATCSKSDGTCIKCVANFEGSLCEHCIQGKHGQSCDEDCPAQCHGNMCQRSNGHCSQGCNTGYSGDKCCLNNDFCLNCSTNANCEVCDNGKFGESCELNCSSNCDEMVCNKNNGHCITCKGDYYGSQCDKECPSNCTAMANGDSKCMQDNGHCTGECIDGYHGEKCDTPCSVFCLNQICDNLGTACKLGCVSGRTGTYCEAVPEDGDDGPPIGIIAGVCGGVAAVIVVVIVIVIIRRRRQSKGFPKQENGASTAVSKDPFVQPDAVPIRSAEVKAPVPQPSTLRYDEEPEDLVEDDEGVPEYQNQNANAEYGNIGDIRKIVPVSKLEDYLKQTTPDEFMEHFKIFPSGLIKSHNDSRKPSNLPRNRYAGVYAYDENRVKLKGLPSDYINASYIDGHKKPKAYIASLGPTKAVMVEFKLFWHMVWQEKVEKIVVVTNLMEESKMKFEQYWPSVNSMESFGTVSVTTESEAVNAEYTVRMFTVKKGTESRTVSQVHFTAWPDKGVPDHVTSIVEFHNRIKSLKTELGGPLLVHCSAGIGRTGTYIALDILTEAGEESGEVDVFNCVMALRQQRVNMVQTSGQYVYLHKAVTHALTYDSKPIPSNKFQAFTANASDADFQQKIDRLRATMEELDEEEKESKRKSKDLTKYNRNGADIPSSRYRPRLFLYQTMGDNDYINAVYVDGFRMKNCFIAAQTPQPDTVADFIKLMLQETCACVVNLEPETLQVKTIGHYLPPDNQTIKHGPFKLSTTKLISPDTYTLRELKVVVEGQREAKEALVYCFQFNKWPGKANTPSDSVAFLRFIKDVKDKTKEASKEDRPIITHCLSGAIKCGLFFAVHNAVEKMESEEQVSISNVMRQIRYRRRAAFPNKDQMAFCYSTVSEYLKSFDTYSNFDLRM